MMIMIPKKDPTASLLPVLLYFHGGAFMLGSNVVINGGHIASTQNIIVVAANYRLGVFGFWAHPDFPTNPSEDYAVTYENDAPFIGNQALMDQQMAMIWTREHIAAFGGDKERITIGGMSAGGQSINAHAVMPSSAPLFDKMISFSGPNGLPYYHHEEARHIYEEQFSIVL